MLNRTTLMIADEILAQFDSGTFLGMEFSEIYIQDVVSADTETFNAAMNYLVELQLMAPTVVKRRRAGKDCFEPGARVL